MNEKRINKEIKTLKKQRDDAELSATALQSQLDRLQEKFDQELETRVAPLKKEIEQHIETEKTTEAICNEAAQRMEEAQKTIDELRAMHKQMCDLAASRAIEIEKLTAEVTSLRAEDVKALRKRLQKKSEEIDALKADIERLKSEAGRATNVDKLQGAMRQQTDTRSYVLPTGLGSSGSPRSNGR